MSTINKSAAPISQQKSNQSLRSWSLTTRRSLMAMYGKAPDALLGTRRAGLRPVALAYPDAAPIVWHGRGYAETDGAFQATWHADGSVTWGKYHFANLTKATRALVKHFGKKALGNKNLPCNPRAARYWGIPVYNPWFSDCHGCIRADLTLEEWGEFYDAIRPCVPPTAVCWTIDEGMDEITLETRLSWGLKVGPAPVFYAEDQEIRAIEGAEAGYVPLSAMLESNMVQSSEPLADAVFENGVTMTALLTCMAKNRQGMACSLKDMQRAQEG